MAQGHGLIGRAGSSQTLSETRLLANAEGCSLAGGNQLTRWMEWSRRDRSPGAPEILEEKK